MLAEFRTDLVIGVAALLSGFVTMIGQTDPTILPDWVGKLGPTGLCVWLVIHYTIVTVPRLEQRFSDLLTAQEQRHREERVKMLEMFDKTLNQKRIDYKSELDQQRADFREELEMQRADFTKIIQSKP